MAEVDKKVSELDTVSSISTSDLAFESVVDPLSTSGYSSKKITEGNKAISYLSSFEFPLLLDTTSKSIIGAINEIYDSMPEDIEDVEFPIDGGGE